MSGLFRFVLLDWYLLDSEYDVVALRRVERLRVIRLDLGLLWEKGAAKIGVPCPAHLRVLVVHRALPGKPSLEVAFGR
jgi:hypothetical protein